MALKDQICVGAIVGVHGVRGAVRVRSFTEEPEAVFTYKPLMDEKGERVFALKCVSVMKDHFIATIQGVSDRTAAEGLKGVKLFVARDALPPTDNRTYYAADLTGLQARDAKGAEIGRVLGVHDYGAGAFLEIQPPNKASFMLPFTDACVPAVDLTQGIATVVVPEGWLDAAKPEKEEDA